MRSTKKIINPNKLTNIENSFLIENETKNKKQIYKGRMISMSNEFYNELNDFLSKNPTEGNRSSFIVRVVANYIKEKTNI